MEYRKFPSSFVYENIIEITKVKEHNRYKVYKFTALHKHKYINMTLKAIVFNNNASDLFVYKYNLMLKKLNQVPKEFILADGKVFNSNDLIKENDKKRMIICFFNEKTLLDYLNETNQFLKSNKNNLSKIKTNIKRIKKNCINALKQLHDSGFCYDKIYPQMFQGNHNLSEIYLQYFENMIVSDSKLHRQKNLMELNLLFSKYIL
jgi:hypothetical protein